MKRLKELEKENNRLRRAVSDLTGNKLILPPVLKAGTVAAASCDCRARIDLALVSECSHSHSPYPESGVCRAH